MDDFDIPGREAPSREPDSASEPAMSAQVRNTIPGGTHPRGPDIGQAALITLLCNDCGIVIGATYALRQRFGRAAYQDYWKAIAVKRHARGHYITVQRLGSGHKRRIALTRFLKRASKA